MLIRCNGNVLVPLSSVDKFVDKGDVIVVYVDDETHFAQGEDAAMIRSLVVRNAPQQQPMAAKEESHVRKEEGISAIPVFPRRRGK